MNKQEIIDRTIEFVKTQLKNAEGGHDWFHIERVCRNAKIIAKNEIADNFIVELGALFHDIADAKFHNGNESIGPKIARNFLEDLTINDTIIGHVENIIKHISYKNSLSDNNSDEIFSSIELDIIQDADRLDAIGAIGIARAFNYGGFKNRALYNPSIEPCLNQNKEAYKKSTAPTINHFYEKLLLLKDQMNTQTGMQMAQERHEFIKIYLKQFYSEWNGNR